jgi:hypothetical protein
MSDNYDARIIFLSNDSESFFFEIFAKIVLQAWEAREAAFSQLGEPLMPPRIVSSIRHAVAQIAQNAQIPDTQKPTGFGGIDNFPMSMPMGPGSNDLVYNIGGQGGYGPTGPGVYPNMPALAPLDVDVNYLDWTAMDWGFGGVDPGMWDAEP